MAAGQGAMAAGLTSRRGGRASVCRNLDTLKRFMAAGTRRAKLRGPERRLSGAPRAAATPASSRPTHGPPLEATPLRVSGQSQPAPVHRATPPAPLPPRARRGPRPPANRRSASPGGHAPMPKTRPRGSGGHVRRVVRPLSCRACGTRGNSCDFVARDLPREAFQCAGHVLPLEEGKQK